MSQIVVNQKSKALPVRILAVCLIVITSSICSAIILPGVGSSAASSTASSGPLQLALITYATGFNSPVGITNAGPGDDRLFVIEQAGLIKIVQADGTVLPSPFLDITARVDSSSNEEGLLGLVFHPNYAGNGFFYLNYTNTTGDIRRTRISRFTVTTDPNVADPNSEDILLTVDQPASNHNAGDIHFGPDGYLYIPLGDGGGTGYFNSNAQTTTLLLGKIVRIDVDAGSGAPPDCKGLGSGNYTIPDTNPFIDGPGTACDEIWAMGLRNPWRSSFDRLTGDFYVGDVGQNAWEEIDFQAANSGGGENYGWNCYEAGTLNPQTTSSCSPISYTFPIFEYNQTGNGCAVTGGYVYRGSQYRAMYGHYLLTDYCSGNFWDLVRDGNSWLATRHTNLTAFGYVTFGEDYKGELYVANINNNTIYHLVEFTPTKSYFLPVIMKLN
jgi:glucose/arabinose dehydrogenase